MKCLTLQVNSLELELLQGKKLMNMLAEVVGLVTALQWAKGLDLACSYCVVLEKLWAETLRSSILFGAEGQAHRVCVLY